MASWSFEPIGVVQSCFAEKFGTPKQGRISPNSRAVIKLSEHLDAPAMLDGLQAFSHIWLLWVFHANSNRASLKKVRPPRLAGEKAGVFASRSPHRPNPIGLSAVRLDKIEGSILHISGVDLISGTPVLDIKPYIPEWDSLPEASDGWLSQHPDPIYSVTFSPLALETMKALEAEQFLALPLNEIQSAIRECLERDPRPTPYRRLEAKQSPNIKDGYGFEIYGLNVCFQWEGNGFLVTRVERTTKESTNDTGPNHSAD